LLLFVEREREREREKRMAPRKNSFMSAAAAVAVLAALCAPSPARASELEVKVCTVSDKDYLSCLQMVDTFFSDSVENTAGRKWSCVKPDEGEEETVLEMIEAGSCNFATDLDAHDLYDANKLHGFQAVAAEDYTGEGKGLTYYGVAVVPASACAANPEITLGDLKGLRSCHTGYKRTSGWTIPLANVVDLEQQAQGPEYIKDKNDYDIMSSFFTGMCAPGGPEEATEMLCANCDGDCIRDSDPYSGYAGALRCLMEGAGDVAFMKETTSLDYAADGADPQPWSKLAMEDLRLVCPDGGCAEVGDFDACNYARIPSHSVAVGKDLPVNDIMNDFMKQAETPEFLAWLETKPALFNSKTKALLPVMQDTQEYLGRLTQVYSILEDLGYY